MVKHQRRLVRSTEGMRACVNQLSAKLHMESGHDMIREIMRGCGMDAGWIETSNRNGEGARKAERVQGPHHTRVDPDPPIDICRGTLRRFGTRGSFSVFPTPQILISPCFLFSLRRHTEETSCFRCEAACVRLFLLRCIILGALILSMLCDARPLGLGLSQDQEQEQEEEQEEEEDVYLVCVVQGSHNIINMVCRRRRRRRVPTGRERNQWRQRIRQRRQRRRPPTQHRRISPLQQSSQRP